MSSPGRKGVFLYKGSSEIIGTESETVVRTLKMLELFSYSTNYSAGLRPSSET